MSTLSVPIVSKQWLLAHGRQLELGSHSRIMGVLNVTPDSFSDGGRFEAIDLALAQAERMIAEGADIIDIGGESTRPGANSVSVEEEQARVIPIIEQLAARTDTLISIDTQHAGTAEVAVKAGAHIVNDIWGLQHDTKIAEVVHAHRAGIVAMHNGRGRDKHPDVIVDQLTYLTRTLDIARDSGIAADALVLDPGFGFAKETADENLDLMARFEELHALGAPLLIGTSRKRFIGAVTGKEAGERDIATAATNVILRLKGAALFRVHNVAISRDALLMADAMIARMEQAGAESPVSSGATRP